MLSSSRRTSRRSPATGWRPPQPFTVKARDGTDRPLRPAVSARPSSTRAGATRSSNHIYPGPQAGSVGTPHASRRPGRRPGAGRAGLRRGRRSTRWARRCARSRSTTAYYGNMGDNGLPDQVSRHAGSSRGAIPWIDLDRVGIYGHSGGGYASADAMLRYPDFFKVGGVAGRATTTTGPTRTTGARSGRDCSRSAATAPRTTTTRRTSCWRRTCGASCCWPTATMDDNVPPYNTCSWWTR